jgi:hypothetical protein
MDENTLDRTMRAINENFDNISTFLGEVATEEDLDGDVGVLTDELPPGFDPEADEEEYEEDEEGDEDE